jgi:hypothetical protein
MFKRIRIQAFLVLSTVAMTNLYAIEDNPVMTAHKLNVATAVNEVARSISSEISTAIRTKDYVRAEELNRSLTLFLKTKGNPAYLIIIPEVADEYASKRKETARLVFQQYRNDLSTTRVGTDALKEEMDAFIRTESELQKLSESGKIDDQIQDRTSQPKADRATSSLPMKADRSKPKTEKPSSRNSKQPTSETKDDPSRLTSTVLDAMNERMLSIQSEYQKKLEEATTDLQRKRIASQHRQDAIKQCLDGIENYYLEIDCELIDSKDEAGNSNAYQITYAILDNSLGLELPDESTMNLSNEWRNLAESSAGTKFQIKLPVFVASTRRSSVVLEQLQVPGSHPYLSICNRKGDVDKIYFFEQPLGSKTRSQHKTNSRPMNDSLSSDGASEDDQVSISIGVFAVWRYPIVESDEVKDLPKQKWPRLP